MDVCYNLGDYRIKRQLLISDILHCHGFWYIDTNSKFFVVLYVCFYSCLEHCAYVAHLKMQCINKK